MRAIILSLAILFLLASCGGSSPAGGGQSPTPDGGLEEGDANPFDIFGETGGGEDAEESDGTGTAADPCATDPSSEACLCRNSRSRRCICLRNPNDERCAEEEKPLAIKTKGEMECSLDTPCDLKLKAAGGSGSYAWSLANPPAHLGLVLETRDDNARATVTATPSLVGSYPFAVTLTDAVSGESASAEIVVDATAVPVIAVYAGKSDGGYAEVADAEGQIDLPVYRDLKLEVTTHGAKLKGLRLRDAPCSMMLSVTENGAVLAHNPSATCTFMGISIWGSPLNGSANVGGTDADTVEGPINRRDGESESYVSVAYLRAYPDVKGMFTLEAEDESGKIGTAQISVGFADDPCLRLAVTAPSVTLRLGAEVEAEEKIKLAVSGGKGPFRFTEIKKDDDGNLTVKKHLTLDGSCEKTNTRICQATAGAAIPPGARLKDLFDEEKKNLPPQTYTVTVTDDGCPGKTATTTVTIAHSVEKDIVLHEDEFLSRINVGSNDTDSRSKLYASFKDKEMKRIAKWVLPINLDHVGGSDADDPEVIPKKIESMDGGGVPSNRRGEGMINVSKFSKVFFRMEDPGSGGAMDTRIYWFRVKAGGWCGRAVIDDSRGYFENSCEDWSDGSDREDCQVTFPIQWKTCDGGENRYPLVDADRNLDGCARGAAAAGAVNPGLAGTGCAVGALIDVIF